MKKFFSLLCATLLVFSVSAAPVAQKAQLVKKAPVAVEQMQKVQLEKAQVANFNQLSAAPALKVTNQKAQTVRGNQMLKKAQAPTRRSAANARKVVNAPQNTAITIGTFSPATYEGEYYVTLTDANSTTQFFFDIDTSVNPFELGKTYTLDEMIADYVAMGDADDWYVWEPATAATYTETVDEKGLTHIVASMTTESDTYDITYDQPEPQDINVTAVDWGYDGSEYDVYVYSETTTYLFELKEDLVYGKAYTYADMVPTWTCTLASSGYPDITATDATLTVTKDEAGLIHIAATMVLSGNKHIIAYDEKAFEPSGVQIEVNGTDLNGRYLSGYGFYLYTATWGDYTVQLAFDATEEKETYTNEEFLANYGLIYSDSEKIQLLKLASDNITITNTETTKTLAGSIYAKNGDEYILNLVYEKPDAKEITLVADTLNFFTKMLSAGYYQMQGYTVDSTYAFSFYFISKSLSGSFTEEDMDAYSTWVDQKDGKKTVVSYQNLSAANIQASLVNDTLYYTGTMTLATNDGQEAEITLNLSCPYKQEWGEWADFAPFDLNTGKYTFTVMFNSPQTQINIPVQVRKDNTGLKQYKFIGWGKGLFTATGIDLIVDMNPDYVCTVAKQDLGLDSGYGENVQVQDYASKTGQNIPSTYDPETGTFDLALTYFISLGSFGANYETMVMDRPITERDTVDIVSTALKYNDSYLASNKIVIFYASDVPNCYLFRVTSANATTVDGTFKWSEGGINDPNSYFSVSGTDKNYFQDGEFTVVTNDKDIALTGWMIGVDEKYYRLDMSYTTPTERDTVYVNSNMLSSFYQESINGYVYQSSNTDYELIQFVTKSSEKLGTFAVADLQYGYSYLLVHKTDQTAVLFQEGEFTVSEDEEGFKLIGTLIGEDEKVYVFNLVQPVGTLEGDTDAPFDATFAWSDMDASIAEGVIGIYATNAEGRTIGLELYADPAATEIPAGVYTISDTQEAGTALQSLGINGGYLTECYAGTRGESGISDCWFIVEGTVTLEYDEYDKLKVVVNGTNSYGQPVTALVQYVKLDPKSTVVITDGELVIDEEMYAQYGITTYLVENDNYGFILPVYADTIVGDFTEDLEYALAKVVDLASMAPADIIDVESIVVTGIEKNITLTAKVLGADTIMYEITATGYYGYIQGDAIDAYEGEFKVADLTIGQAKKNNVNYITIKGINELGDTINFAVAGKLVDNAIPAGEYTDVMASTGFNDNNNVTTSFVGNNVGIWFVQGGNLTVAKDGSMIFVGVNSHDALVTINFTVPVLPVTDYYLVGWINGAAYGIEGDIDNFGDYHFVDGKVRATFNELSYIQVKDNNKQIYGTDTYKDPVHVGNAILVANGREKIAINGGAEYEYTLTVNEDGTLEIFYEEVSTGLNDINADVKANKVVRNGRLMVIKNAKVYSVLGQPIQ